MTSGIGLEHKPLPLAYGTNFGKAVPHWRIREITWPKFCKLLEKPAEAKTSALSYLPGLIEPGPGAKCKCNEFLHRTKATVASRWALTLDADYCGNAGRALVDNLRNLYVTAAAHTTWSSSEDDERYRVIVPLSREVKPLEYGPMARWLMRTLGEGMFDATCDQASRLMYLPAAPDGGDRYGLYLFNGLPLLDVDMCLDLAGGPDVVIPKEPVVAGEIGDLSLKHQKQLRGLFVKLYDQEEGNRDSLLLWVLKCVKESGMDPGIAERFLVEAAVACGLDEEVYWEKVQRVLG